MAEIAKLFHSPKPKRVVLPIGNIWKGSKKVLSPQKAKQSRVAGTVRSVGHSSSSLGGIGGSGSSASRSNILAMYGISGDEMQECQSGIQVVSSSEEELAASSSSLAPQGPIVEYFDQELLCMKRVIGGGEAILAEMKEGQNGFLEYTWPGGDWLISEGPNLVLKAPKNEFAEKSQVKPKSKAKRKAKKGLGQETCRESCCKGCFQGSCQCSRTCCQSCCKGWSSPY